MAFPSENARKWPGTVLVKFSRTQIDTVSSTALRKNSAEDEAKYSVHIAIISEDNDGFQR